ncbi:hypothetical protein CA982_13290 [Gordonia lacunae]|uniref:Uncharacterized protein n=2 Tax=Gordonia lacunae TaxID=417102 RepID=A0A243QA53_9ACTN|nr:hypothetical protein CA982_13290 [Gordonia lacunae]
MSGLSDDTGMMGIVDPHAYESFVSRHWTLESLFTHFATQMHRRTLLLWETGDEGSWTITVENSPVAAHYPIVRQAAGPSTATRGELVVVSYDTLTMAAQFPHKRVDAYKEWQGSAVDVAVGTYVCAVSQLTEPGMVRATTAQTSIYN